MTTKNNDAEYIALAIALAHENSQDGQNGPFGAVVAKNGLVLGKGTNRVVAGCDPTAHAEIIAIRNSCSSLGTHDLSGCTIYSSCEPCPMCLSAILWARITRVVFACSRSDAANAGFDDEFFYREVALDWPQRSISGVQMAQEAGLEVFEQWNSNLNRNMY